MTNGFVPMCKTMLQSSNLCELILKAQIKTSEVEPGGFPGVGVREGSGACVLLAGSAQAFGWLLSEQDPV